MKKILMFSLLLFGCDDLSDSGESDYPPSFSAVQGTGGMLGGTGTGVIPGNLGSDETSDTPELPTECVDAEMSLFSACKQIQILSRPDEYLNLVYCTNACVDPCVAGDCRRRCEANFRAFYSDCSDKYQFCSDLVNFTGGCVARCSKQLAVCSDSENCENFEDPDLNQCLEAYLECSDNC